MNQQMNAYIDAVCAQIKCREVHAAVRLELESHIGERVDALVAGGRTEPEAVALALRQMGDPAAVGLGLGKVHRPRTDWQLIATVSCLVLVGLWVAYAAAVSQSWGPASLLPKQLLWTVLGTAVAAGCSYYDYRRLQSYGGWLVAAAALAAVAAATAGRATPFASAGSPLLFVPGLAALFASWDWERQSSGWLAALLGWLPSILYLVLNEFRFVPLYLALWGTLLLMSRPPLRRLQPPGLTALVGAVLLLKYILSQPYRIERFRLWLMPWEDTWGGIGFMVAQSRRLLREAGLWGHGALTREDFLAEVHTNEAFPYLVHTLGWVAGGALCLLILLFLLRMSRAAAQCRNRFGSFLVVGFLTVFGLAFFWNIGMHAGWMPLATVDLPFISFGRQQVLQLAAVGLMLSVFRRKDLGGVNNTQ